VYLRLTGHGLALEEPDDCTSLAVRVPPGLVAQLAAALRVTGLGIPAGPAEFDLCVDRLRTQAAADRIGPDWPIRWDAMISYAAARGWISADGAFVRAHIELVG
jgi:hypothetical protein